MGSVVNKFLSNPRWLHWDLDERRTTIGYMFTLGGRHIYWKSVVQSLLALSTIGLEYKTLADEALWLIGLIKALGFSEVGFGRIVIVRESSFCQIIWCIIQGSNT